jgi:predicted RNase H-like HicB family nuclease
MCKMLAPPEARGISSGSVAKSGSFRRTLRRSTAYTGRVMRHAKGGYVAFIEEVPGVSGRGWTPDEAEWKLRLPFAEYVATERREGRLSGEIRVLWME